MYIRVPREFRLQSVPASIILSEEDIAKLADPYPASVELTDEHATVQFDSPRAAADFVASLRGQIPYSATDMTADEDAIFNDPDVRALARAGVGSDASFDAIDRGARRWGIAAFSVATSTLVLSLSAFVMAIIALAH